MEAEGGNVVKRGCSTLELVAILKRVDGPFSKLRDLYDVLACVLGVPLSEGRVEAEECWELLKKDKIGGELPLYLLLQQWLGKRRGDGKPPGLTALLKALDSIRMGEEADAVRKVFYPEPKKKDVEVASSSRDDVEVADHRRDESPNLRESFELMKRKFLEGEQERQRLEEENSLLRGQLKIKYEKLEETKSAKTQEPPIKEELEEPLADPLEVVNLNLSNIFQSGESPDEDGGNVGEFSSDTAVEQERKINLNMMDDPSHPNYPFEFVVDVEESEESGGGSFPNTDERCEIDMNVVVRPTTTPNNTPSATMGPRLVLVGSSPERPKLKTSQLSVDLRVQKNADVVLANEKKKEGHAHHRKPGELELEKECPNSFILANVDDGGLGNVTGCEGVGGSSTDNPAVTETERRTSYNTRRNRSTRLPSCDSEEEYADQRAQDEAENDKDFHLDPVRLQSKQRRHAQLRGRNTRQSSLPKAAIATPRSKPRKSTQSRHSGLRFRMPLASEKQQTSTQNAAPEATLHSTATTKSSTSSEVDGKEEPNSSRKKRKWNRMVMPNHITIHEVTGELPMYQCTLCNAKFKAKTSIIYHMFCGTESKPFKCETCGKGFVFKNQFECHGRTHTGEKPHVCSKCQRGFSLRGNLIQHMRSHTGEKAFVCQECERGFTTALILRRHTLTHTGEQPFACTHCHKRFSQMGNLKQHLYIHTGERRFSCSFCSKSFGLKGTLDVHLLRIHSKERPYACDLCTKTFSRSYDLRQHLQIHSGDKPFQCEICQSSFTQKSNLNSHIRKKHNRLDRGANVNEDVA